MKISVRFTMPGINTVITNHFEMLFRDMLGKSSHEVKNGEGLGDQFLVFMAIVMKSNKFTVVRINA